MRERVDRLCCGVWDVVLAGLFLLCVLLRPFVLSSFPLHSPTPALVVSRDEEKDMAIAKHVMGVHVNANASATLVEGEIGIAMMKK